MIQRRKNLSFTLETRQTIGIVCECVGENFDSNVPAQIRVPRPIDLPHAALSDGRQDFESAEFAASR